jgi:hypothetical protein
MLSSRKITDRLSQSPPKKSAHTAQKIKHDEILEESTTGLQHEVLEEWSTKGLCKHEVIENYTQKVPISVR